MNEGTMIEGRKLATVPLKGNYTIPTTSVLEVLPAQEPEDEFEVLEGQVEAPTPFPEIKSAAALLADDSIVPPDEVIHKLLHKGLKAYLGGASKSKKSWMAQSLAIAVATGKKFLDFETVQGRVLYVNAEIIEPCLRQRIRSLWSKMGGTAPEELGLLDILTLRGANSDMDKLRAELSMKAKDKGYVLIVVDPIYKLMKDSDENSAKDVNQICNSLERMAKDTGAAVLYVAHFSKGNQAKKQSLDRVSGSGVWARDADTIINLTPHAEEDCFTVEVTLRNFEEVLPFVVKWDFPLMIKQDNLNPANLEKSGNKARLSITENDVLPLIPDGEGEPILQNTLIEKLNAKGFGKNTIKAMLKNMVDEGNMHQREIPRSGTRAAVAYHKKPAESAFGRATRTKK